MKILTIVVRLLLGLVFTFFGSNFFFHFVPMPTPPPGPVGDFTKVFMDSGYFNVIFAMQLLSGLLLLIGKFVPLALTILAAMIFNILTFHILIDPAGIGPGIFVALLWAFLVWRYRENFAGLLQP